MRTGILGGTFDPIHIAHLHAGECAIDQARLDRILFIPAGDPWQKQDRLVSPGQHRLAMTELAVEGVPGFKVDDREVRRRGSTYTIDTLETFPENEDLILILGADAARGLPTWHRYADLLERAQILVAPRPGTDSTMVASLVPEAGFIDMAVLEVSGTDIREMARNGHPFRFLVPGPVYEYIEEHKLYRNDAEADRVEALIEPEETS